MRTLSVICLGVLLAGCGRPSGEAVESTRPNPFSSEPAPVGDASTNAVLDVDAADAGENAEAATTQAELSASTSGPPSLPLSAANTTIQFVGTHAADDPNPRTGVFKEFTGQVTFADGNAPAAIEVEIQTSSLETPLGNLNNHLKSPDFFDVREHPTATFVSTAIAPADGAADQFTVTGKLTLLGNTNEVSFPATFAASASGPTMKGQLTIDRTAFGMTGVADRVNKEVEISFDVGQPTP